MIASSHRTRSAATECTGNAGSGQALVLPVTPEIITSRDAANFHLNPNFSPAGGP
jgi:hypothetical protein